MLDGIKLPHQFLKVEITGLAGQNRTLPDIKPLGNRLTDQQVNRSEFKTLLELKHEYAEALIYVRENDQIHQLELLKRTSLHRSRFKVYYNFFHTPRTISLQKIEFLV